MPKMIIIIIIKTLPNFTLNRPSFFRPCRYNCLQTNQEVTKKPMSLGSLFQIVACQKHWLKFDKYCQSKNIERLMGNFKLSTNTNYLSSNYPKRNVPSFRPITLDERDQSLQTLSNNPLKCIADWSLAHLQTTQSHHSAKSY